MTIEQNKNFVQSGGEGQRKKTAVKIAVRYELRTYAVGAGHSSSGTNFCRLYQFRFCRLCQSGFCALGCALWWLEIRKTPDTACLFDIPEIKIHRTV